MKIRLGFLALGLIALLGSLLASSQRISAYQTTDRPSAVPAVGPSVLGAGRTPLGGAIPAPAIALTYTTYLPVVMRPVVGIMGNLTQGGAPAPSISLKLWFYNGSSFSIVGTTTTNSSGYYMFAGVPSLGAGQSYLVEYLNLEHNSSRLYLWDSADVTSYTGSSTVSLGTSDLADIPLVAPSPAATIALPYPFKWTRRAATPSDSYFWELFDPYDNNPYASTYGLGYASGYVLSHLPAGFGPGVWYGWGVGVFDASGGIGISYYYQSVRFSNWGTSTSGPLDMTPRTAGGRHDLPHPDRPEK